MHKRNACSGFVLGIEIYYPKRSIGGGTFPKVFGEARQGKLPTADTAYSLLIKKEYT